jgi:AraC-like DNA-binding protein
LHIGGRGMTTVDYITPEATCEQATIDFGGIPISDRREAWRVVMQPFWEIKPGETIDGGDWAGSLQLAVAGDAIISAARAPCMAFERAWPHIRSGGVDQILVQVYESGGFRGMCGARDVVLESGDIGFLDLAQPFQTAEAASFSVTLAVPRAKLVTLMQGENLHGVVISRDTASAHLIGSHLKALAGVINRLNQAEANAAVDATVAMIAGAWQKLRNGPPAPRHAAYATLRQTICDFIEVHLQDSQLSPARLCTHFRVSRATLYRMFDIDGGIAAYVQERRLRRCFDILSQVSCTPVWRGRIADLAFTYGFSSESHFSRAFRRRFGMTPGEARALSKQAAPRNIAAVPMADWLAALRAYNVMVS